MPAACNISADTFQAFQRPSLLLAHLQQGSMQLPCGPQSLDRVSQRRGSYEPQQDTSHNRASGGTYGRESSGSILLDAIMGPSIGGNHAGPVHADPSRMLGHAFSGEQPSLHRVAPPSGSLSQGLHVHGDPLDSMQHEASMLSSCAGSVSGPRPALGPHHYEDPLSSMADRMRRKSQECVPPMMGGDAEGSAHAPPGQRSWRGMQIPDRGRRALSRTGSMHSTWLSGQEGGSVHGSSMHVMDRSVHGFDRSVYGGDRSVHGGDRSVHGGSVHGGRVNLLMRRHRMAPSSHTSLALLEKEQVRDAHYLQTCPLPLASCSMPHFGHRPCCAYTTILILHTHTHTDWAIKHILLLTCRSMQVHSGPSSFWGPTTLGPFAWAPLQPPRPLAPLAPPSPAVPTPWHGFPMSGAMQQGPRRRAARMAGA